MTRRVLISAQSGEVRAAWLDDGRLTDVIIQRDDRLSVADNVYLGRVVGLDDALDAAFVEIGLARPGFLPRAEAPKGTSAGDAILVRAVREPSEDKGARLTALRAPPSDLADATAGATPPVLLRAATDPLAAAFSADQAPDKIVIDDPAVFAQAKRALTARPEVAARLRLDLDPDPLFERAGIEAEIDALLDPRVGLPSGGHLLIEPVRTLTAIDVNAGRHGRGGAAGSALAVNLEAADEIARQVRLRNLSGLIVVDFLRLGTPAVRSRVAAALKRALKGDPQSPQVHAMRPSGLLEMTRRRARPPLHEILSEPCGIGGAGRVMDAVSAAYAALRALRHAAARQPGRRPRLLAGPAVVAALAGPAAPARAALEERLGRPIDLRSEPGRAGSEIVLE